MTSINRFGVWWMCLLAGGALSAVQGCGGSSAGVGDSALNGTGGGTTPLATGGALGSGGIVGTGGVDGGAPVGSGGVGTGGGGPGGVDGGMLGTGGGIVGSGGAGPGGAGGAAPGGTGGASVPACGEPGKQCCDGNSCNSGGCCVSGICMAAGGTCVGLGGGTCSAGACGTCGGPGLPCCGTTPSTGTCTAPSTKCNAGTCTKCGDLGSPCCASASGGAATCNSAKAMCSNNVCVTCGVPGSACCPGSLCDNPGCCYNNACVAETTTCGTSGGTCQAGRCSACGSAAQPCCSNLCYDGLLCKSGACTACGGVGQPCCAAGTGTAACQTGTACTGSGADAVCARCGSLGDTCCAGNACNEGCCSGGRCLAVGSPACPTGSPDGGGQSDAPIGGSGGAGGMGGTGGTIPPSTGGAGGTTATGGAGGTTIPPWAPPPGCGDGVVVFPERCDDGNTVPFDGCSSDCQNEPVCNSSGPCTSTCGDGIVLGEDCDDGNTVDGDGCSSTCKVEPGFTCAQPALGNPLLVPVVYRDFKFHAPADFQPSVTGSTAASPGMVNPDLDSEGKPTFTGLTGTAVAVTSKDSFASWYRNTSGVNHATPSKLALWDNGSGAYVNRYGASGQQWAITDLAYFCGEVGSEVLDANGVAIPCTYRYMSGTDCDIAAAKGEQLMKCNLNDGTYEGIFLVKGVDGNPLFFPDDGDTFSKSDMTGAQVPSTPAGLYDASGTWPWDLDASGNKILHNFSFTSEVRYWFKYQADISYTLDITGDDDVWVFINKKLALDLGGIHSPVSGAVTLDSTTATKLGLTAGNVYEVAVFQAERQTTSSTFKITLNGFNTAPSVCSPN